MATGDPILISNPNQDDFFGDATSLTASAKGALVSCFHVEKRPRRPGSPSPETAIVARCLDGGTGVHGVSDNFLVGGEGVRGSGPVGVLGDASGFGTGVGVRGIAGQNGIGVAGNGQRYGVMANGGESGIHATGTGANSNGVTASGVAIGALGVGTGPAASAIGLAGRATNGTGVVGQSTAGVGVFAQGSTFGVVAEARDVGVAADATGGAASVAVRAVARTGTSLAAWTQTGYIMNGRSEEGAGVVVGARRHGVLGWSEQASGVRGQAIGANPSAMVVLPDGTERRLYCTEMPDCWIEDVGETVLVKGYARVPIDAILQRSIEDYQVFLSVYGPFDVYVAKRSRDSFEIRARGATPANRVMCGWRVMARRSDVNAPRWARVTRTPTSARIRKALREGDRR